MPLQDETSLPVELLRIFDSAVKLWEDVFYSSTSRPPARLDRLSVRGLSAL
jgi:hypothetical protein